MRIPIPEEYGSGGGGDTLSYAIAVEELTRIDSSVAITVAAHLARDDADLPVRDGGAEQEWLPDLAREEAAAFGLTERAQLRRRCDARPPSSATGSG
jgi:alkylation response protein AidB-like acyl-CoA dehydrogenase